MRSPAEWVIQTKLNSFSAYGHCAAPAKADKSPALDAHSSDELNRLDFIGHGTSSMSL
jgi:hypothetical protein